MPTNVTRTISRLARSTGLSRRLLLATGLLLLALAGAEVDGLLPAAVVGLLLCSRIWNARPQAHNRVAAGPDDARRAA